jgi:hypothetical protein
MKIKNHSVPVYKTNTIRSVYTQLKAIRSLEKSNRVLDEMSSGEGAPDLPDAEPPTLGGPTWSHTRWAGRHGAVDAGRANSKLPTLGRTREPPARTSCCRGPHLGGVDDGGRTCIGGGNARFGVVAADICIWEAAADCI